MNGITFEKHVLSKVISKRPWAFDICITWHVLVQTDPK